MKSNQLFSWFVNHDKVSSMLVRNFLSQKTKNIIFTLAILLLIASNLATLLSWRAHESMHNVMSQTIGVFSTELAKKVLLKSPKVHLEVSVEHRSQLLNKQIAQNKLLIRNLQGELSAITVKQQNLVKKLALNGVKAKTAIQLIEKRIQKNLARNVVALPSEAVPAISLATSVAVTAMDIYDACETMKDFNNVLVEMGQTATTTGVCNLPIPTTASVQTMLKNNWQSSANTISLAAKTYNLPSLNLSYPTSTSVKNFICSTFSMC